MAQPRFTKRPRAKTISFLPLGGLGAVVGAPALGWIADKTSWHTVFYVIAATYLAGGLCWLAVNCTIPVLRSAGVRAAR